MKELKIKIIEWKDISKWFWDKFCFPRRELVAGWLDYHNDEIKRLFESYIIDYLHLSTKSESNMKSLEMICKSWNKKVAEITEKTKELIMMK